MAGRCDRPKNFAKHARLNVLDYRAQIETAAREMESALAAENPETGAGDLKQLRTAIAALDVVTKLLADLLMDKAMEAMLRKRGVIQ
jgi:hypothetical protein